MNDTGYWHRYRLSRRRLLSRAAAVGLGSLSLGAFGCSTAHESGPAATLTEEPENTTSQARAGGTFRSYVAADATNFDPLASSSPATFSHIAAYTYPRLLKFSAAVFPDNATGGVEGDLAESFELSPDRLSLALKLRQGLRWEHRAPTNGRLIDAQDVAYSWNKFARFSPQRYDLAYEKDQAPGSPVDSISSPNPQTVVFKLKQVDASLAGLLASDRLLYVMPRESEKDFDPRVETRGYGPWLMKENRPGLRIWNKNPDYYVKGRPFADSLEHAIVPEYAVRLAQFRAGLIYTSVVTQDDVLPTKRDLPDLLLRRDANFATAPSTLAFGYDGDSPWKDERVRQAVALLIDRELLIDMKTNRAKFAANGLAVDVRYHSAVGAGWEGYWVDPLDSDKFGPNSRYFQFDRGEAKKLLLAAGFPEGIDTLLHYNAGNEYGAAYTRTAEVTSGMLHEGGVRARLDPREYQNDWLPNYHLGYAATANVGKPIRGFPGIAYRVVPSMPTPATQIYSTLHRNGARFHGMTPDGKNAHMGDPKLNDTIDKVRVEFDRAKQVEQIHEIQRYFTGQSYYVPRAATVKPLTLTWPSLGNMGVFQPSPGENLGGERNVHLWVDQTKPPFTSA